MNETKQIKSELPTLKEIGQAEDVFRRLKEGLDALATSDMSVVELRHATRTTGIPEWSWRLATFPGGTLDAYYGRNPLEGVDELFPDTERAITLKKRALERRIDDLDAQRRDVEGELAQLRELEIETPG